VIPHTVLIEAPYSLVLGDEVRVRISAVNLYGPSVTSNDGNGAIIELIPSAPVALSNVEAQTSASQISLQWEDG
jgi:hypothetical protein